MAQVHVKRETQLAKLRELIAAATPDECVIWPFSHRGNGYGQVRTEDGKTDYAHRVAYTMAKGEIPPGFFVLHHCDVRACVNAPYHLYLGTHTDNMRDAKRKGRLRGGGPRGERNGRARIKEWQVTNIRELHAIGKSYRELAETYKIKQRAVKAICTGQTWKHAPGPTTKALSTVTAELEGALWDLEKENRTLEERKLAIQERIADAKRQLAEIDRKRAEESAKSSEEHS